MEKWVNARLGSEARHFQTRNEAQITLWVFRYWNKLPREAVTSLSLSLFTSRVYAFLEDMLSPNTNYQPYNWKPTKLHSLCSTEGPSIQCPYSSGLELFVFAKGDFSMNQKGSKLKYVNRRDFQIQNVGTFVHTLLADYAIRCWVLGLSKDVTCKLSAPHSSGLVVGFRENCWLCALSDMRAKMRLAWKGVGEREEWSCSECLKLGWYSHCPILIRKIHLTIFVLLPSSAWGSWVSGDLFHDSAEVNQAIPKTLSCQVMGSLWAWKQCQGSQRVKQQSEGNSLMKRWEGKRTPFLPCPLVILLHYISCLSFPLVHFLLFLPAPYRCFSLETLICTDSLTVPRPFCFPSTPAHKHDKRKELSPLPLPSMSFCQLMDHCQVHDTKTEQFTFKEKASFRQTQGLFPPEDVPQGGGI